MRQIPVGEPAATAAWNLGAPRAAWVSPAFHAAALRAGGHDNGAPGLRPVYGSDYYAAFVTDADGYRIKPYYEPGEW